MVRLSELTEPRTAETRCNILSGPIAADPAGSHFGQMRHTTLGSPRLITLPILPTRVTARHYSQPTCNTRLSTTHGLFGGMGPTSCPEFRPSSQSIMIIRASRMPPLWNVHIMLINLGWFDGKLGESPNGRQAADPYMNCPQIGNDQAPLDSRQWTMYACRQWTNIQSGAPYS
jgi:hypothetical protein